MISAYVNDGGGIAYRPSTPLRERVGRSANSHNRYGTVMSGTKLEVADWLKWLTSLPVGS